MPKGKPFVEKLPAKTMRQCLCKASNKYECMKQRYNTSFSFATCLNGCSCHKTESGAEIDNTTWKRLRKKL